MYRAFRALALAITMGGGLATAAHAGVGYQHLTIPDPQGAPVEVGVWYPTDAAGKPTNVELFIQALAPGAPVKGKALPLVVLSHGTGGGFAGHADTARALAEAGFVAATLTHTGDNWRDQSQASQVWNRPRQLKLLVNYMLADWAQHDRIDSRRIGAFGFSAGGFTVLAAAGGEPDLTKVPGHCQAHPTFFECVLVRTHPLTGEMPVAWTHDARIKAVVAAAPALGYAFGREGLANVRVPLQLWRASDDEILPNPFYAEAVRQSLPTPPEFHLVENAGHFDFLQPCPAELQQSAPQICKSRPGFDRAAFHQGLNREVVAFFRKTLAP
jgi:predicted dienelactone hydrolase